MVRPTFGPIFENLGPGADLVGPLPLFISSPRCFLHFCLLHNEKLLCCSHFMSLQYMQIWYVPLLGPFLKIWGLGPIWWVHFHCFLIPLDVSYIFAFYTMKKYCVVLILCLYNICEIWYVPLLGPFLKIWGLGPIWWVHFHCLLVPLDVSYIFAFYTMKKYCVVLILCHYNICKYGTSHFWAHF